MLETYSRMRRFSTGSAGAGPRARRVLCLVLAGCAAVLLCSSRTMGENAAAREAAIKAAYLFNFVKFVDWPAQALPENSPTITIGVLGEDPLTAALSPLNGKSVRGKTLIVRHYSDTAALGNVQILFIGASERARVGQDLRSLRNTNILTVGGMAGFVQSGGMINFTNESNHVRFEVNPAAAERAGLRMSSQLLKVGRIVRA
jgi:hypothetical protein